jgi:hypothetical protein
VLPLTASGNSGVFSRHRSNCQCNFNGNIIVGDYANGNIYTFELNVFEDNNIAQRWLRSWRALPTGQNNLKRTANHSLQLECETGVGLNGNSFVELPTVYLQTEDGDYLITEDGDYLIADQNIVFTQGANPQAMLRWSDDGGHTWSNEHWASMGKIGATSTRVMWRRLGMTLKLRDRVYEVSGSDPVRIYITGAELMLSGTNA